MLLNEVVEWFDYLIEQFVSRAFVHTPHCALPTPPTEIADLPGVLVMGGSDVTDPLVQERVRELLGRRGADVVMRSACIVELSDFLFYLHKVCRIFATVLCKAFKSQCTLWFIDRIFCRASITSQK